MKRMGHQTLSMSGIIAGKDDSQDSGAVRIGSVADQGKLSYTY